MRKAWDAEIATAQLWEFRYLNYFLVEITHTVLGWLVNLGTTSQDHYEATWMPYITIQRERHAVLTALQIHSLITIEGPAISVTDKGRTYFGWVDRKPLTNYTPSAAATA